MVYDLVTGLLHEVRFDESQGRLLELSGNPPVRGEPWLKYSKFLETP